ncbi:MAG TPA: DUF1444 family protein [Pyrinomonadaceae bacterium]|nr:DUF1444 family protein [Pyrinomonadaceae bacterium]
MIFKFTNKFKKTDLDEKNAFCIRVIDILKEIFPNSDFVCNEDADVIRVNELKLGLTNLRSKFLLTSQTNFELKELVREHFISLSNILESDNNDENPSWDLVKTLLIPQLMPVEFISQLPVISFPFADEVAIGVVVDGEKSYEYVNQENLQDWSISKEELYQTAIKNLTEKSFDIEMTCVPPPNGIVVVNMLDSFDAVRILAPQMQEFFAEKLGDAFYFGIPNRDFLICWSKKGDDEFQNSIKQQIADDFEERPYPLSKYVFEFVENDGIRQRKNFNSNTENWITDN